MNKNQEFTISTPKAWDKLKEFLKNRIIENFSIIGEKPNLSELKDEWFNFYLAHNKRVLYDFFDEQDIYINISILSYDNNFLPTIKNYKLEDSEVKGYTKRIEAENFIFNKAMEVLENKL